MICRYWTRIFINGHLWVISFAESRFYGHSCKRKEAETFVPPLQSTKTKSLWKKHLLLVLKSVVPGGLCACVGVERIVWIRLCGSTLSGYFAVVEAEGAWGLHGVGAMWEGVNCSSVSCCQYFGQSPILCKSLNQIIPFQVVCLSFQLQIYNLRKICQAKFSIIFRHRG